jgi:hypothetical protein
MLNRGTGCKLLSEEAQLFVWISKGDHSVHRIPEGFSSSPRQ